MKLLIVTQAVDLDDPVLGFFHRWLAEFSKRCERLHVICLKEGRHELPSNVFVHSLGKENQRTANSEQRTVKRSLYALRFYGYIWRLRREYDAVFVHMNQEYVLLGAPLWKLWGKKVSMWRNHYGGNWLTNIAVAWCDVVFCTSKNSYTAKFKKTKLMPLGIDTDFFSPGPETAKPQHRSILFLGRLDAPKRADVFIRALELLHEQNVPLSATMIGDASDPASKYAHDVRNLASPLALEGILSMRPGVTNEKARDLFRTHSVYCNLSPEGMFDKTIGEAMASGCIVVSGNAGVREVVPQALVPGESAKSAASALRVALEMPEAKQRAFAVASRAFIEHKHSLRLLVDNVTGILGR